MQVKNSAFCASMLAAAAITLTSCGARVEVPTAHVGKIQTASGLLDGLKYPSSFRLPPSMVVKNRLILLETSHFPIEESVTLFMPKDKLNINFDLRGTLYIAAERSEELFKDLTAKPTNLDRISIIQAQDVYQTYGQQLVRSKIRSLLSKYSIEELMASRESINDEISKEMTELFTSKNYPLGVIQFGLADIQYPDIIIKAQELAKEREVAIETAEAEKMVKMKEAEASLEVARKQQEIDLVEAETQVLVEKKLSDAVNDAFVTQRSLKILDAMASNSNKTFILPMEAFQKPEMLIGVYSDVMKTDRVATNPKASAPVATAP